LFVVQGLPDGSSETQVPLPPEPLQMNPAAHPIPVEALHELAHCEAFAQVRLLAQLTMAPAPHVPFEHENWVTWPELQAEPHTVPLA
jgi:hypothetical protein